MLLPSVGAQYDFGSSALAVELSRLVKVIPILPK